MDASGAELGRPFEDVFFKAGDGAEVNAWFYPANPDSPRTRLVALLCHGNAGNISTRLDVYEALLETGVAVFAFDYRGYGRSRGRLSEDGTYLDAQAAHRWLREKGFADTNILAYGESLGGGVASELCRRETTGGLILQSTFTSIADIGSELFPWLPVRWMSRIKYDTLSRLPRLRVPVLVMHSRSDALIRFHHAEKNFAAANEPKLFCELQGDHNDPLGERAKFVDGIERFLKLLESGVSAKSPAAGPRP
jgi:fermentation-respiration switch protein FrsA (DUF1100 family)